MSYDSTFREQKHLQHPLILTHTWSSWVLSSISIRLSRIPWEKARWRDPAGSFWTEATGWEYTHLGFWGRCYLLKPCRVSRVDRAPMRSRKTYRLIWPDSLIHEPCNHTHIDNGFPTFTMITYIFAFRFTQDSCLISLCPKDSRSLQQSTKLSIISGLFVILLL